jgi:FkbM family methyltransferase
MARFSLYELLPALPPLTVLDIGALEHPDQPPRHAHLIDNGRARVIGFEPDAEACEALNRRYGPPHRFLPQFVGAGGPATFHRTNWPDTSSLYRPNTPLLELFTGLAECMTVVQLAPVETTRLDDVPEAAPVDYLKIDVQGAELDVFNGARLAIGTALVIQTEVAFVELYQGQPLFAEIDAWLRQRGFWFHSFVDTVSLSFKPFKIGTGAIDHGLNQRLAADAVYTRHPLQLGGLPPDDLRKLAVLAHDLYASYDLALRCLDAADRRDGGGSAAAYLSRLAQR